MRQASSLLHTGNGPSGSTSMRTVTTSRNNSSRNNSSSNNSSSNLNLGQGEGGYTTTTTTTTTMRRRASSRAGESAETVGRLEYGEHNDADDDDDDDTTTMSCMLLLACLSRPPLADQACLQCVAQLAAAAMSWLVASAPHHASSPPVGPCYALSGVVRLCQALSEGFGNGHQLRVEELSPCHP